MEDLGSEFHFIIRTHIQLKSLTMTEADKDLI